MATLLVAGTSAATAAAPVIEIISPAEGSVVVPDGEEPIDINSIFSADADKNVSTVLSLYSLTSGQYIDPFTGNELADWMGVAPDFLTRLDTGPNDYDITSIWDPSVLQSGSYRMFVHAASHPYPMNRVDSATASVDFRIAACAEDNDAPLASIQSPAEGEGFVGAGQHMLLGDVQEECENGILNMLLSLYNITEGHWITQGGEMSSVWQPIVPDFANEADFLNSKVWGYDLELMLGSYKLFTHTVDTLGNSSFAVSREFEVTGAM